MTFYGLTGEEHFDYTEAGLTGVQGEALEFLAESIHAVGIIEYDQNCVDYYKRLQGSSFSYTKESWYYYGNTRTSSSTSSGGS